MNRRHFLGTLMASVAALSVDPSSLMWRPDSVTATPLTPEAIASFKALLKAFALGLSKELGDADFRFAGASRIGGDGMRHQFNIGLSLPETIGPQGLDPGRYLKPMVHAMAFRVKAAKPTAFGLLKLPRGVEEAHTVTLPNGLSVRGVQMFDPLPVFADEQWKTRVDVLCG